MTNEKAIDLLRRMQEPEAYEPQITEEAFEALELAIRALGTDTNVGTKDVPDINVGDMISRQAAIDLLKQMRKDGDMVPWEGKNVFARIRELPTIQPEHGTNLAEVGTNCSEFPNNSDAISRQQAIDARYANDSATTR